VEENKGFFFSYFWAYYMGSQCFGSLISAFVLGRFSQIYFSLIMVGIAGVAVIGFMFLREPY
jgi:hypothetical protein